MTVGGIVFMALSWALVLGLTGYTMARVLRNK